MGRYLENPSFVDDRIWWDYFFAIGDVKASVISFDVEKCIKYKFFSCSSQESVPNW